MGSLSFVVDLSKLIIHQSDSVRYSFCKKVVKWCIDIERGYDNLVYRSSIFATFFISEYKCSRILIKDK